MRSRCAAALAVVLAIATVAPGVTRAEEEPPPPIGDAALARFRAGSEAYATGNYARAAQEFEAGYAIEAWSGFLFAWAQAERRGGACDQAIALYRRFLATEPPPPPPAQRLTREGIAACEAVARPSARGAPPPPPPSPPPPPMSARDRPGFQHKLAVGLGAGAVVAGGLATTFYVLSRNDASAANDQPTHPQAQALHDRSRDRLLIARIGAGVAVGLGIAATLRFVLHRPAPRVDVSVVPGNEPRVFVGGRF